MTPHPCQRSDSYAYKFTDLLDTIKLLDKTPVAVHEHAKVEHEANTHQKKQRSSKHSEVDDSHSLQGKHGKTHGIC